MEYIGQRNHPSPSTPCHTEWRFVHEYVLATKAGQKVIEVIRNDAMVTCQTRTPNKWEQEQTSPYLWFLYTGKNIRENIGQMIIMVGVPTLISIKRPRDRI